MRSSFYSLVLSLVLVSGVSFGGVNSPTPFTSALVTDGCEFIREQIRNLPDSGGEVYLLPGTYVCTSMILIKKSHVRLVGSGRELTTLKLADYSPSPLLVIGDDKIIKDQNGNFITASRVEDVEISDLTLDGNLVNQDPSKECGNGSCDGDVSNIRNNALTIRGASYIRIFRVTAHSSVSGGIVTEKYCDHVHVKDFTSYGHYFDGFAGYQTESSIFENLKLSYNRNAGISIDIDFNNNRFSGGILESNGDVGIFARNIDGVVFENLTINRSGNHGVFLAEADHPGTCANNNEFRSVSVNQSRGYGILISSECTGNSVTGFSSFDRNSSGCYFVNPRTSMSVSQETVCHN